MKVAQETPTTKWRKRLLKELAFQDHLKSIGSEELEAFIATKTLTSSNHDTVVSLDWPHFCFAATEGCGGDKGWCYTFQGRHAQRSHHEKVAIVDYAARHAPELFATKIAKEVEDYVADGALDYPNLRYSGSGEVHEAHVTALALLVQRGVRLWGFTRSVPIAKALRKIGAAVIFSCDVTTDPKMRIWAVSEGFPLAYTSIGVDDIPPKGTIVTFPLHRSGAVREVVDHKSVCPKVLDEYLHGDRVPGACQYVCQRCHLSKER